MVVIILNVERFTNSSIIFIFLIKEINPNREEKN